jgi:hypothetical protein
MGLGDVGQKTLMRSIRPSRPPRWGTPTGRYLAGLALTISGAVAIQSGNSYALFLIVQGTLAFIAGWVVLPAGGLRRGLLLLPAYLAATAQIAGPQMTPATVVLLVCWLVLWRRPAVSFLAVIPLLVVTIAITNAFHDVSSMVFTTPVTALALFGCAWLAYLLDRRPSRLAHHLSRGA